MKHNSNKLKNAKQTLIKLDLIKKFMFSIN